MIIKTITCHDVYNFGASLQAYALMTYLNSLGNNTEIIDYKPDYLSNHYNLWSIDNPIYDKFIVRYLYLLAKLPGRLIRKYGKRKKRFDNFTTKYLKLTNVRYSSNESLKNNLPEADIYIAGSDQIWNTSFNNGKDPAFYLDFVPKDKIKASYAASFAIESLPNEYKEKVKRLLINFDYISVREKSGLNILNDLNIDKGIQVIDPVFLLDKDQWFELESNSELIKFDEQYLICYDFDSNELVKEICLKIAKEKNLKIYSFFKNDYADKTFYNIGPLEFLSLIKNSQYVVSNSFHGTAFALIFEKEFVVVNREEQINTRMKDLIESFNLKERLTYRSAKISQLEPINYDLINSNIFKETKKSKDYLDEVLFECKRKKF